MLFNKPPLSFDDQVALLQQRGLEVNGLETAKHYLSQINYYRFAAYLLPFEEDHATHRLKAGTTFDQVLDVYIFDRELRLLVLDAIERVEVSIRTQFAYTFSHTHGAHAHLDAGLFKARWNYADNRVKLESEVNQSREKFIQHFKNTYDEPLPPIWVTVEIMTLGQLSKWYANVSSGADRNAVANAYDMDEINLVSFLHHLSIIRNYCAHHSRLWNREFQFTFKLPRRRPVQVVKEMNRQGVSIRKIYNTLVVLAYLMDVISPGHSWKARLLELIDKHAIDVSKMGFPADWAKQDIWK